MGRRIITKDSIIHSDLKHISYFFRNVITKREKPRAKTTNFLNALLMWRDANVRDDIIII